MRHRTPGHSHPATMLRTTQQYALVEIMGRAIVVAATSVADTKKIHTAAACARPPCLLPFPRSALIHPEHAAAGGMPDHHAAGHDVLGDLLPMARGAVEGHDAAASRRKGGARQSAASPEESGFISGHMQSIVDGEIRSAGGVDIRGQCP